jgi:hypothetical protein
MKLFISYSSQDREIVTSLVKDLEGLIKTLHPGSEFGVWYDQELIGGHDWWDGILYAIEACDLFVFALTASALESDACKREINYGHQLNKRILPILLADDVDTTLLPLALQRIQWIDYRRWDSKEAHHNLLRGLANLPQPQPMPDPRPPRPEAPVSPMALIMQQLQAPALDLQTQAGLVHQLKQYLNQPRHSSQSRQMLERLAQHPDLRASIGQEIKDLLAESQPRRVENPPPQPAPVNPQPPFLQNNVPQPGTPAPAGGQKQSVGLGPIAVGAGVGLVIGVIASAGALDASYYNIFTGYYESYVDFETICGNLLVFPAIGAVAGWFVGRSRKAGSG